MGNAEEEAGMRLDDWAIGPVIKAADLSRSWQQQYKSASTSTTTSLPQGTCRACCAHVCICELIVRHPCRP